MKVVMKQETKCLSCKRPIPFGTEAEQIVYDGRARYIHPECTGKRNKEMTEWDKTVTESKGAGQ